MTMIISKNNSQGVITQGDDHWQKESLVYQHGNVTPNDNKKLDNKLNVLSKLNNKNLSEKEKAMLFSQHENKNNLKENSKEEILENSEGLLLMNTISVFFLQNKIKKISTNNKVNINKVIDVHLAKINHLNDNVQSTNTHKILPLKTKETFAQKVTGTNSINQTSIEKQDKKSDVVSIVNKRAKKILSEIKFEKDPAIENKTENVQPKKMSKPILESKLLSELSETHKAITPDSVEEKHLLEKTKDKNVMQNSVQGVQTEKNTFHEKNENKVIETPRILNHPQRLEDNIKTTAKNIKEVLKHQRHTQVERANLTYVDNDKKIESKKEIEPKKEIEFKQEIDDKKVQLIVSPQQELVLQSNVNDKVELKSTLNVPNWNILHSQKSTKTNNITYVFKQWGNEQHKLKINFFIENQIQLIALTGRVYQATFDSLNQYQGRNTLSLNEKLSDEPWQIHSVDADPEKENRHSR